MVRLPYSVTALLIATALSGCKTDSQLLNEEARAYVAAHPALDRKKASAIAANRLQKGMTMEQVTAAWGKPVIVQRFGNNTEYWLFGCVWPHFCNGLSMEDPPEAQYESRAFFKGGTLVDWQD